MRTLRFHRSQVPIRAAATACLLPVLMLLLGKVLAASEAAPALAMDEVARQATTASGHRIEAVADGARILCRMQDLEGRLHAEGLELRSVDEGEAGIMQVRALTVGRPGHQAALGPGQVAVDGPLARLIRPGLVTEVRTSSQGIRQDWLLAARPAGDGPLSLRIAFAGAQIQRIRDDQVGLTIDGGRHLLWHRLQVIDAAGTRLAAHFAPDPQHAQTVRILVDDARAEYPLRIDPTFTDADWVSVWTSMPGADGTIRAMTVDGNGDLIVGGEFTGIGSVVANHIARWDGSTWHSLDGGVNNDVYALAVSGSDVYVGGSFTSAGGSAINRIARWDGSAWHALGTGMSTNTVYALAVSGSDVYAGGTFGSAGGVSTLRIAHWDGSSWSALGSGMNATVQALAIVGTDLYAGGSFSTAGGVSVNRIARWDGSTWYALGDGASGAIYALATDGSDLYAGASGNFTTVGSVTTGYIARWDGSDWYALGSGVNSNPYALCVSGSDLYAVGNFTTAGGSAANRVARWDGSAWYACGGGIDQIYVYATAVADGTLYVGGSFTSADSTEALRLAAWDGSDWSAVDDGMNGTVNALAVSETALYAGGEFTTAGAVSASRIARWDGSAWYALGSGMNNTVHALLLDGTDLYVGGEFTTAGGSAANRIARWDGSAWNTLGSGMNNTVRALALANGTLYAGGLFTTAGGNSTSRIAAWDGSTWAALGSGLSSYAYALAASGSDLYAGGLFTSAGGNTASRVAHWDGSTWSALGSGVSSTVHALSLTGSDLYVGGEFTSAGGNTARYIAHWDGSTWQALGAGMNTHVYALARVDNDLYAGGRFTTADGNPTDYIARWNGSAWSALGSGVDHYVQALAAEGNDLYVGGEFFSAGAAASPFCARLVVPAIVTYNANGADSGTVPDEQEKHYQVDLTLATNSGSLARNGHSFNGWNTAADGSGTAYAVGATYAQEAALALYAEWSPSTYTISFDANTGSGSMGDQNKTHDIDLVLNANSFTKTGYTFSGWNTAANGSGTSYADEATYADNADRTLYAQWTLNTYTVNFHSNGGSGSMDAQTKTHDLDLTLSASTFTRSGYTFNGWNTAANGSGTSYADEATYTANSAVTLFAQWDPDTYTVSFAANGGTGVMADQTKTHDVALVLNTNAFTRADYYFSGWNTASDGSGTAYADLATYTANAAVTMYAQWTTLGDYTWTGTSDGATWADEGNWDIGDGSPGSAGDGYPDDAADSATIASTTDNITTPASATTIGALVLTSGHGGNLILGGDLRLEDGSGQNGTLAASGWSGFFDWNGMTLTLDTAGVSHDLGDADGSAFAASWLNMASAATITLPPGAFVPWLDIDADTTLRLSSDAEISVRALSQATIAAALSLGPEVDLGLRPIDTGITGSGSIAGGIVRYQPNNTRTYAIDNLTITSPVWLNSISDSASLTIPDARDFANDVRILTGSSAGTYAFAGDASITGDLLIYSNEDAGSKNATITLTASKTLAISGRFGYVNPGGSGTTALNSASNACAVTIGGDLLFADTDGTFTVDQGGADWTVGGAVIDLGGVDTWTHSNGGLILSAANADTLVDELWNGACEYPVTDWSDTDGFNWQDWGGGTSMTTTAADVHGGQRALPETADGGGHGLYLMHPSSLSVGATYRLEGWVKRSDPGDDIDLGITLKNASDVTVLDATASSVETVGDWERLRADVVIPSAVASGYIYTWRTTATGTVYFDDITLKRQAAPSSVELTSGGHALGPLTLSLDRDLDLLDAASIDDLTISTTSALTIGDSALTLRSGDLTRSDVTGTEGDQVISSALTLGGNAAWSLAGEGRLTVSGAIGDGGSGYSLALSGSSTLALSGANTYSGGTTVGSGCTLLVTNSSGSGTGSGSVSVASGGSLGGDGTISGSLSIADSATLTPGDGGGGQLACGDLTLNSSTVLAFDLDAPTATDDDQVAVTGTLTLDGTINVSDLGGFAVGSYPLITYTSTLTDNTLTVGTLPLGFAATIADDGSTISLVVTATAPPSDYTWTGTSDGATWADEGNWDNGDGTPGSAGDGYPDDAADTATIDATAHDLSTPTSALTLGALTFATGFTGSFTLENTLTLDSFYGESGSLTLGGAKNDYTFTTLDSDTVTSHDIILDGSLLINGGYVSANNSTITVGADGSGDVAITQHGIWATPGINTILLAGDGDFGPTGVGNNFHLQQANGVTTHLATQSCSAENLITGDATAHWTSGHAAYRLTITDNATSSFNGATYASDFGMIFQKNFQSGDFRPATITFSGSFTQIQTLDADLLCQHVEIRNAWNNNTTTLESAGHAITLTGDLHLGHNLYDYRGGLLLLEGASSLAIGNDVVFYADDDTERNALVVDTGGSNQITVGGSWRMHTADADGEFDAQQSTVTFTSGATETLDPQGWSFYHVSFDDQGAGAGHWDLQEAWDIDGDLTLTDGELDLNGLNITIAGSYSAHATDAVLTPGTDPTITFDGTGNVTLNPGADDADHDFEELDINKSSGRVTLTGSDLTVNDWVTVTSGELRIGSGRTLTVTSATATTVASGATISGAGTLAGPLTIAGGGIIAPGDGAAGDLSCGDLILNDTSVLDFELGAGTEDQISVTGDLTLDGTINVTDLGSFDYGSFPIITYSGTLSDQTLSVGTLPSGYTATITDDGSTISLVVSPIPSHLDFTWTGTSDGATWADQGNWDSGDGTPGDDGYPNDASDTATIDATAHDLSTRSIALTLGALTFNDIFTGSLTLEAALTLDSATGESGDLTLNGTGGNYTLTTLDSDTVTSHNIDLDGSLIINGGQLRPNASTISIGVDGTGDLQIANDSSVYLDNAETLYLAGSGTLANPSINGNLQIYTLQQANGVTTTQTNNISCQALITGDATSTFTTDGSDPLNFQISDGDRCQLNGADFAANGTTFYRWYFNAGCTGGDFGNLLVFVTNTDANTLDAALSADDLSLYTFINDTQVRLTSGGYAITLDDDLGLGLNNQTTRGGMLTLSGNSPLTVGDNLLIEEDDGVQRNALIVDTNGTSAISIGGSWSIETGGEFLPEASTVTFISGGSETLTTNSQPFYHLTFDDQGAGSGSWQIQDALDVDGDLTLTDGELDLNSLNLTIGGSYSAHATDAVLTPGTDPTITFDGTGNVTLNPGADDANHDFEELDINKSSGRVTLTGADLTVNDWVTVTSGELRLGTGRTLTVTSATATTVASGATISGAGTLAGPLTIAGGGIIAPGDGAAGDLTCGDLILNDTSVLNFELGAGTEDQISVNGDLTLDGTLNVTDLGSFGPGSYPLITYSGDLTDNGLSIAPLPGGHNARITASADTVSLVIIASLQSASWSDLDGNGLDTGDTLTLTFDQSVTIDTVAISQFTLPVTSDSLSTSTLANQGPSTAIIISLAGTPQLSPGGTYNSSNLTAGDPSGIFINDATGITFGGGTPVETGDAASAVDIGPTSSTVALEWDDDGTATKSWPLGIVFLESTHNTVSAGLDVTLRNSGSVMSNIDIKCAHSTPSAWTPTATTVGENSFLLKADNASLPAGDPTNPGLYELTLSTSDQDLANNVYSGGTVDWEAFYQAPASLSAGIGVEQTITITITAEQTP